MSVDHSHQERKEVFYHPVWYSPCSPFDEGKLPDLHNKPTAMATSSSAVDANSSQNAGLSSPDANRDLNEKDGKGPITSEKGDSASKSATDQKGKSRKRRGKEVVLVKGCRILHLTQNFAPFHCSGQNMKQAVNPNLTPYFEDFQC